MIDLDPVPTRFLLGELSDDERDEFEERLLADDDVEALVGAAEDDLFDAYALGELRGARQARFEDRLLASPGGRRKLAWARALAAAADAPRRRRARGWWLAVGAGAVAAAAALALVVWPRHTAEVDPAAVVAIALPPPTRGAGPVLHLTRQTDRARLLVETTGPITAARLDGPAGAVPVTIEPGPPIALVVTAAQLPAGSYVLTVTGAAGAAEFSFLVERAP